MRAAIYARYSSDMQRDASIEDQVRICKERIKREGWSLAATYSDRAMSGAQMLRPGYQKLLQEVRDGRVEIVVAEALDRISRDQEHVAAFFKQLTFAGVKLITVAEGEISELHVGLKGTMNALFIKDLAAKTHRGLEGRVRQGQSAGGRLYGYDIVREYDARGEPIRGKRKINRPQAEIIRTIFREFAAGKSSRTIAKEFNERGVPGPGGRRWNDYAIHGNRRRGSGVLNCELYIGRLVWNRQRFIKDPQSGKRQARLNPKEEWIIEDVPHLRIVDDKLWSRVRTRQGRFSIDEGDSRTGANLNQRHRDQFLLSGLIKCQSCGSNYIVVGKDTYGCSTRRTKGTCCNDHRLNRHEIEAKVLSGLKTQLTDPGLVEHFIREFNAEVARVSTNSSNNRRAVERELRETDKKIAAIMAAIEQGVITKTTKSRLLELEDEKVRLDARIAAPAPVPYPSLHPKLAAVYRDKVERLEVSLNDPGIRFEASEIIRTVIDRIEVGPNDADDDGSQQTDTKIVLYGQLAAVIALAESRHGIDNKGRLSCVAGTCSQFAGPGGCCPRALSLHL